MKITDLLPPLFLTFILTVLFSFVIGLELHSYRRSNEEDLGFGTTRTLTLSGIAGFIFSVLDPSNTLFVAGFLALSAFLLINYWQRQEKNPSLIPPIMTTLTYAMGPIAIREPLWFIMVYVVVILLILGESHGIRKFSDAITATEVVTLAKFLIMVGVILPFLPERPIAPVIPVTYTQVWLAVVMVSGFSYVSYLARTYFFPQSGTLLTGTLGGLYSSTVATIVLARKERAQHDPLTSTAIILASTMLYLRMMVLILVLGPKSISLPLLLPFSAFLVLSLGAAWGFHHFIRVEKPPPGDSSHETHPPHPLEVRTAVIFAAAFLLFAALTHMIFGEFGAGGLHALSFAAGFTDITPYILSLLAGNFSISKSALEGAIILATGSNNFVNGLYALIITRERTVLPALLWLSTAFLFSLVYALLIR